MFTPIKDYRLLRRVRGELPIGDRAWITPLIARQILDLVDRGVSVQLIASRVMPGTDDDALTLRLMELVAEIYRPSLLGELASVSKRRFGLTADQVEEIEAYANKR